MKNEARTRSRETRKPHDNENKIAHKGEREGKHEEQRKKNKLQCEQEVKNEARTRSKETREQRVESTRLSGVCFSLLHN